MRSKPTEQAKKAALGIAFGVMMSGSVISGIPGNVNGLARALTCGNCVMQLKNGVPKQFAGVMTDDQKKVFRRALRNRKK
jgi:hypothetical protein